MVWIARRDKDGAPSLTLSLTIRHSEQSEESRIYADVCANSLPS